MLCSTANYKLHALRRIRKYLTLGKKSDIQRILYNYASVIWMLYRKKDYQKIEKIQYKTLIIYNSSKSYDKLLTRSNEVPIHQKHLHALATEIFKSLTDINPDFIKTLFKIKEMPFMKWICLKITINKFYVLWN